MIEELKVLINTLADMPTLVVWVALGFFVFKLLTLASILGAVVKCYQWTMHAVNNFIDAPRKPKVVHTKLPSGLTIVGVESALYAQLQRICGKRTRIDSPYIHNGSIEWLADAITLQEQVDNGAVLIQAAPHIAGARNMTEEERREEQRRLMKNNAELDC